MKFNLVNIRQLWGQQRAYYYDERGVLKSFLLKVTDLIPEDNYVTIAKGRAPFRVVELLELTEIINNLKNINNNNCQLDEFNVNRIIPPV